MKVLFKVDGVDNYLPMQLCLVNPSPIYGVAVYCDCFYVNLNLLVFNANRVDPDQMLISVIPDLGLHHLQRTFFLWNKPLHDKTNKMTCAPSDDRSAWASAQSDQNLHCELKVGT